MQTADGKTALVKVVPASNDQYCIRAQTADGKIVLVSPDVTTPILEYAMYGLVGFSNVNDDWSTARSNCNSDTPTLAVFPAARAALRHNPFTQSTSILRMYMTGSFPVSSGEISMYIFNDQSTAYNVQVVYSSTPASTGSDMLSWSVHGSFNIAANITSAILSTYDISTLLPDTNLSVGLIFTADKNNTGYPTIADAEFGPDAIVIGFAET